MRDDLIFKHISRPRYNRYLFATGNDNSRAYKLYIGNLRLAQAFYPLISQFEVIFRNSLNDALTTKFKDADWIINQKRGFMSDPSLRQSFFLKKSIQKSEDQLTKKGIPISSGKIISDQMFSVWTSFYSRAHYKLVGGSPIHAFPGRPPSEKRAQIHAKLEDIQKFRNRVFHCEPICFNGNHIDCSEATEIRINLLNLVSWIDPDLLLFFSNLDNTQNEIDAIMKI